MGRLGIWIVLGLLILGAALAAGIATHKASPGLSGWAAGISLFVLGATLLAVLWYSLETRRLVRVQRDASEIADHPWLHVAGWPSSDLLARDPVTSLGGIEAHLPIQNVGRTPALLRAITVEHESQEGSAECRVVPGGDVNPRALAPGQKFAVKIIEIRYRTQGPPIVNVDVTIHYQTIYGGTGLTILRLRYADHVWKSRETHYECTLSSGLRLPRSGAAGSPWTGT